MEFTTVRNARDIEHHTHRQDWRQSLPKSGVTWLQRSPSTTMMEDRTSELNEAVRVTQSGSNRLGEFDRDFRDAKSESTQEQSNPLDAS